MDTNKLYRITEEDIHIIIENTVRRILREETGYSQESIKQTWMDAINQIGVENFIDLIDEKVYDENKEHYDWDKEDIYGELEPQTGLSYDDLEAMEPEQISDLMLNRLSPDLQYKILIYVSDQYSDLELTDNVKNPDEVVKNIDDYNDDIEGEPVEVNVNTELDYDDDDEREDSEFIGMDEYED